MSPLTRALIAFLATWFCSRLSLQVQIVALRHQLMAYQRSASRPRLRPADRIFWSWLSRRWSRWREVLFFVKPATVIAWQRKRFRDRWTRISGKGTPGRPPISPEIRELIRKISAANPRWGSPRILGELRKLGIEVAKSTVTENPTAHWTAQQIVEAFPWDRAPKYRLRDRDAIYGERFRRRIESMGIEKVLSAPRSPRQNPYVERLIGSIRRDCLDHVIVLNERHLRRILARYFDDYHRRRTHLSLDMDRPDPRPVQPPDRGTVVEFPDVGGLHHHCERLAA